MRFPQILIDFRISLATIVILSVFAALYASEQVAGESADSTASEKLVLGASLPEGFVSPTRLGEVIWRQQPAYRAIEGQHFGVCFRHIQQHGIAMTAPVVMTMQQRDDGALAGMQHMRFIYPAPTRQPAPAQAQAVQADGSGQVVDIPAQNYAVIAHRGIVTQAMREDMLSTLQQAIADRGWSIAGAPEFLGYHGPRTPPAEKVWEMQLPYSIEK